MSSNSIASLQFHSFTLISSLTSKTMRITVQVNHQDDIIYQSQKFMDSQLPPELAVLFQNVVGFYEYLYKICTRKMVDRLSFSNGTLKIKVNIEGKVRLVTIVMKKMVEDKQSRDHQFMLTSICDQNEEAKESRVSEDILSKLQSCSGPHLKLAMLRQNNRFKKSVSRIPEHATSTITPKIRESPPTRFQAMSRYNKLKTEDSYPQHINHKSFSEGKTMYIRSKTLNLHKKLKDNNLDLSNTEFKINEVKQLVTYEWNRLVLLNLGYNNIGTEGLHVLTNACWPALKTLYVCFNNIYKVEWMPANICFLKTLSLSGNKIKEIPRNIHKLQFLQELFIYNNKIELLPEELTLMQQLKNLSICSDLLTEDGNKLDHSKNRRVLMRLKNRKVQVWE